MRKNDPSLESLLLTFTLSDFRDWCHSRNESPSFDLLLRYLLEQEIISEKSACHYVVPRHIDMLVTSKKKPNISAAVLYATEKYPLSKAVIWRLWSKYKPDENHSKK